MDINIILAGIGAGITYSLTSFAKKEGQVFDWFKFVSTVVVGGVVGLGGALLDLPVEVGYVYLINLGLVPVIENVVKSLYRKVWLRLFTKTE